MSRKLSYTEKYVCYIDALGFSNSIMNEIPGIYEKNADYFFNLISIMKDLSQKQDIYLKDFKVSQFSDCLVASCACKIESLLLLINYVNKLQIELLSCECSSRGAITRGDIFHDLFTYKNINKESYIFGKSLVEAVHLEKEAHLPKVILSENVKNDLILSGYNYEHIICTDEDIYYIDYIKNIEYFDDDSKFIKIKTFIENSLRSNSDEHTLSKYKWLASKFNARLEHKNSPNIRKIDLSKYH